MAPDLVPDPTTVAGHFPGRPIVPGVALLDAVWRRLLVDGLVAGAPSLARGVRFLRPVAPHRTLALKASVIGDGARFLLADGGEVVTRGWLGGDELPVAEWQDLDDEAVPLAGVSAADLLPHRPPMRLVEAVTSWTDTGARCRARIGGSCPLVSADRAPAWALVEVAAQAAAAHAALRWGKAVPDRPGAIVGLPALELRTASVPCRRALTAAVEVVRTSPPAVLYRAVVAGGEAVLMTGELTVVPELPERRDA